MEECVECHRQQDAPTACDSCHSEKDEYERVRTGPWQVTHGADWKATHGMGNLRYCATCHPDDYCTGCHGVSLPHDAAFGNTHGDEAKRNPRSCAQCHDVEKVCTSCHGMRMPHEAGFLAKHTKVAAKVDDPRCSRCHRVEDCIFCHERHTHPGNAKISNAGGDAR